MQQTFINELQGNFYLRTPKLEKPSLIYYVVVMNGRKYRFATGVKVYPKHWDIKKQEAYISVSLNELDNTNNSIVNTKIAILKDCFSDFKTYLCEHPNEIINSEILLKQYIYRNKQKRNMDCIAFLNKKLEEYTGASDKTKKDYSNGIKNLDRYMKEGHEVTSFDEIDKKYIKGFYEFLRKIDDAPTTDGKLSLNYINKQISQLATMLNKFAVENDVMKLQVLNDWNYKTWTIKDKATKNIDEIALRDDEVLLLWNYWHKLKDTKYKDTLALFLLECLTGQRYSDIDELFPGIETQSDVKSVQMVQKKTAKKIEFDIIFELTNEILAEYKDRSPQKVTVDYFNKLLKKIAKAAGIKGKQLVTRHSGENTTVKTNNKERYECVKSHTGRRTFITLLKLRNWDNRKIQTYSGHDTIDMVEHYAKIVSPKDYKLFNETLKNNPEKILRYVDEDMNKELFRNSVINQKDNSDKDPFNYIFAGNLLLKLSELENKKIEIYNLQETEDAIKILKDISRIDKIDKEKYKGNLELKDKVVKIVNVVLAIIIWRQDYTLLQLFQNSIQELELGIVLPDIHTIKGYFDFYQNKNRS